MPADVASLDLPVAGPFRRVKELSFEEAMRILLTLLKQPPPGFEYLQDLIPDLSDANAVISYINGAISQLKQRPQIVEYQTKNGLNDDEVKALHVYKCEDPYPVYKWLNAWLMSSRRDEEVKSAVGPFFIILNRAMSKLPKVKSSAARAIKVRNIPALRATFDTYKQRCAPGNQLSFWGFASFSTDDAVINSSQFMGGLDEQAIIFSCGSLEGVDMEPFAPSGMKEKEILPLCPTIFEVQTAVMIGCKLSIGVKQLDNNAFAYVRVADAIPSAESKTDVKVVSTNPVPTPGTATATPDSSKKNDPPVVLTAPAECDDAGFLKLVSEAKDIDKITHLRLGGDAVGGVDCEITDKTLELIVSKFPNLVELDLQRCPKITDGGLHHVSKLSNVTSLNLSRCKKITDAGFEYVSRLSRITSLSLWGCGEITDVALHHVSNLPNITTLDLSACIKITDAGLLRVSKLSGLTSLDLSWCGAITGAGLEHLSKLSCINSLNLAGCKKITAEAKKKLKAALPNCNILEKEQTADDQSELYAPPKCDDAGFVKLVSEAKDVDKITHLHLGGDAVGGGDCEITDKTLELIVSKFPNLVELDLQRCSKISDDGLRHVSKLSNVTSLDLARCNEITDAGFEYVSRLSRITSLSLWGCPKFTDVALHHVSNLPNITTLDLSACIKITDAGLLRVAKLSSLTSLNLAWCGEITDAGMEHLSKLSNIASLNLAGCDKITAEAKKKFKAALPNCKVVS